MAGRAVGQVLAGRAGRARAVPLELVGRVADQDAVVAGRAHVRAGLGARPGRVVVRPALVVRRRLLVGEAVRQVVARVVGARSSLGARADGLLWGRRGWLERVDIGSRRNFRMGRRAGRCVGDFMDKKEQRGHGEHYFSLTTHFPSRVHCLMESPSRAHAYWPNVHCQESAEGAAAAVAARARTVAKNCILVVVVCVWRMVVTKKRCWGGVLDRGRR